MKRRSKKLPIWFKITIVFPTILFLLAATAIKGINSERVQGLAYRMINKVSRLKILSCKANLDIIRRRISLNDLSIYNGETGERLDLDKLRLDFKILPIVRGMIDIKSLEVDNLKISSPKRPSKRKGMRLTSLLFLKSIKIEDGKIRGVSVVLPHGGIDVEEASLSLDQPLLKNTHLKLEAKDIRYTKDGKDVVSVGIASIDGTTDIGRWSATFPYVGDLDGKIMVFNAASQALKDISFQGGIEVAYSDEGFRFKSYEVEMDGGKAEVSGRIDPRSEVYEIGILIKEPICIQSLYNQNIFLDTAGCISGRLQLNGRGIDLKNTTGDLEFELTHTKTSPTGVPIAGKGKIHIENGIASLAEGEIKGGGGNVNLKGEFNYLHPNISLAFEGKNIPIEAVLGRFSSIYYHPTGGIAQRVTGRLEGWKESIRFSLDVDAAPVSYYEIVVERAHMSLNITYTKLALKGEVYQGGRETGRVLLDMEMGERLETGKRRKKYVLEARLQNHELQNSFARYTLSGIGTGEVKFQGTNETFSGTGRATIKNGSFLRIPFVELSSNVRFKPRNVTFDNTSLTMQNEDPFLFKSPSVIEISESNIKFSIAPSEGLKLEARYLKPEGRWMIDKAIYSSHRNPNWLVQASGSIKDGGLNIKMGGVLDAAALSYTKALVNDAAGPIELKNIVLTGPAGDVSINGVASLKNNRLLLKGFGYEISGIKGDLVFKGKEIYSKDLVGEVEYGNFKVSGEIRHSRDAVSLVDIAFSGRSLSYTTQDRAFKMEFDADVALKGSMPSPTLTGTLNIIEGKYTKKFSFLEGFAKKSYDSYDEEKRWSRWKDLKLGLSIRTSGDLRIENNIGKIWLNANLDIGGTPLKPQTYGNIEVTGGEIDYAGAEFEVEKGVVELKGLSAPPYIEFTASEEIEGYDVSVIVKGPTNKLYVDVQSTPPLDRNEIYSLIAFGSKGGEGTASFFGPNMSASVAAEQAGAIVEGGITKLMPVDKFKIKTRRSESGKDVTQIELRKTISDRLNINFATDINAEDAQQTFRAEYLVTDSLLVKSERLGNNNYRFGISLRLKE